jgi:hypothetical protein
MEYKKTSFENEEDSSSGGDNTLVDDFNLQLPDGCENEVKLYQETLKSMVDSSCKSCHTEGGNASAAFAFEDLDIDNSQIIQDITNGDADKLISKLNGEISHAGGVLIDDKGSVLIKGFFQLVKSCR